MIRKESTKLTIVKNQTYQRKQGQIDFAFFLFDFMMSIVTKY